MRTEISWLTKLVRLFALIVGLVSIYFAVTQIPIALRHYTDLPENYELIFIGPIKEKYFRSFPDRNVEAEISLIVRGVLEKNGRIQFEKRGFNFHIYGTKDKLRVLDSEAAPKRFVGFKKQGFDAQITDNGREIHTFKRKWGRIGTAPGGSILLASDWYRSPPYSRIEVEIIFKTPEKYYWMFVYPMAGVSLSFLIFCLSLAMGSYDKKKYIANFPFGRQSPREFRTKRS